MQMVKKHLALIIVICFFSGICFAFDYWWLDILVENYRVNFETRPSIQRAFFFKDLISFQQATGFPHGVDNDQLVGRFNWKPNPNRRNDPSFRYYETIYSTMRKQGYSYAFIMESDVVSIVGKRRYWSYALFMMRDGIEYYSWANRYDTPIIF